MKVEQPHSERPYHHGDLRATLIRVTGILLEREGPEAVSFRAVCRAAGVSQAAPYNHFQGREDLLAAVAEAGYRRLALSQAQALDRPSARERLVALGLDHLRFADDNPQLYRLMFTGFLADWNAHPQALAARGVAEGPMRGALADLLALYGGEAGFDACLLAWQALLHGLAMMCIDPATLLPAGRRRAEVVAAAIALFVNGMAPRAAGR